MDGHFESGPSAVARSSPPPSVYVPDQGLTFDVAYAATIGCRLADHSIRSCETVARTPWSRVFRAEGPAFAAPVALKFFLQPGTLMLHPEAADAYYGALARASGAFVGDPALSCIRPLDCDSAHGMVVAEWVSGRTLSRAIQAAPADEAIRLLRQAGLWLAKLHRLSPADRAPLDTGLLLDHLGEELARAPAIASLPLVDRAVRLLCRTAETVAGESVPHAVSHGDFKPDNLLLSSGAMVGLDFELAFRNATVADAAQFLNHLLPLLYSPGRSRHAHLAEAMTQAFLYGYREDGALALPDRPLLWVRVQHAVRTLLKLSQWSSPPRSWVSQWTLRAALTEILTQTERAFAAAPQYGTRATWH